MTADGASALGSTFLPEPPDRGGGARSAARAWRALRPGDRRRAARRPADLRPAGERRRAAAHRPDPRPARRVRRRRPRAVGDLDRPGLGAPGRGPRPRPGRRGTRRARPGAARRPRASRRRPVSASRCPGSRISASSPGRRGRTSAATSARGSPPSGARQRSSWSARRGSRIQASGAAALVRRIRDAGGRRSRPGSGPARCERRRRRRPSRPAYAARRTMGTPDARAILRPMTHDRSRVRRAEHDGAPSRDVLVSRPGRGVRAGLRRCRPTGSSARSTSIAPGASTTASSRR